MQSFGPATRTWFEESFPAATQIQRRGWPVIAAGRHALLVAPTGSGKTLAAFLWGIDRAAALPDDAPAGTRILYVSPLKALAHDVERNLREPLAGVRRIAQRLGAPLRPLGVDVRTGDTSQAERRRIARAPSEILVTTPESLFLVLGSQAREILRTVHTVIVDEVHALAPTKRGAHLALSLERLVELCDGDPQRIGLSATVRPTDEVARFLGGDRAVEVVDAAEPPDLVLRVSVPVPDMTNVPPPDAAGEGGAAIQVQLRVPTATSTERGLWPAIYPELLRDIREHRSTIVFVNSRTLCERLTQRLNDLAGEEIALAHHGSVSHERRAQIEDGLKRGDLRAIVATSSLELGIDMGAVDLVLLVESPGSVARGLQRVGRAGHAVGDTSQGVLYPKFRGDLLECAVVSRRMLRGEIEAIRCLAQPLDVLAQQVVAMCCDAPRTVEEVSRTVRRSQPYLELSQAALGAVLDMLTGRFAGSELADLRPRLRWDRARDLLSPRRGTQMVSRLNAGTIPDRGTFAVHLGGDGPRIGELDEEMVYETRDGDVILLGASSWRVEEITRDRVLVTPAPGESGRMPFWRGDGPGRPIELGRAIGAFVRELEGLGQPALVEHLERELPLDRLAAENLAAYLDEQRAETELLPTDRTIVVERFRDELGDWRVCLLTPFGARVHAPWAMALERRLSRQNGLEVQLMYADEGIVLRFADVEDLPGTDELFFEPEEVEELVTEQLGSTSLFATLFRENAVRSLLVTRRRPDQRQPLWAQRIKSRALLATVERHPDFPVVLETYRQALADVFDLPGLRELLAGVRRRDVRVHAVTTRSPSPFARNLVFAYVAQYLYDGDSPVAERRAQALTLDKNLLGELLGQAELRELLDEAVIDELEAELAGLAEERHARDRDELHDLLRRVGDLSPAELAERSAGDPEPWLAELSDEGRATRITVNGESRWIAVEEAGLYRDALGCAPPAGLPADALVPVPDGLERLVRRHARTHGPFVAADLERRHGLAAERVLPVLRALEQEGVVFRGEIRPGGAGVEWCDTEILRRLKRRTLARLRGEVAAVDADTFARFLVHWHGLGGVDRRQERLEEVVAQLEGLALPWSAWVDTVLPQRVAGFTLDALDALAARGRVVWIGRGARGPGDGRVALYLREHAAELAQDVATEDEPAAPDAEVAERIAQHLERRGASFLTEIERAVRAERPDTPAAELEGALWDLVWAGRVTNDTFQPLRTLGRGGGAGGSGRRARRGSTLGGGRWSLVADLVEPGAQDPTRRALALAELLLERYGVVGRDAVQAEGIAGGWGPIYTVLRRMEEAGRIRRGHFVDGLRGAQFGHPGAVERLRAARRDGGEPEVVVLDATDPAQPWGGTFPWPPAGREGSTPPRRVAGARVVLVGGAPAVYLRAGRRHLTTFPGTLARDEIARAAFAALVDLPRARGRRLVLLESVDGTPALESPWRAALEAAGFVADYRGLMPDPARERTAGDGGGGTGWRSERAGG